MRLTDSADRPPRHCAKSGRADGPFVDFQVQIDPLPQAPHNLFLHALVVEEAAKLLGMVPAKEAEALRAELAELRPQIEAIVEVLAKAADLEEALQRLNEMSGHQTIGALLTDLKERTG